MYLCAQMQLHTAFIGLKGLRRLTILKVVNIWLMRTEIHVMTDFVIRKRRLKPTIHRHAHVAGDKSADKSACKCTGSWWRRTSPYMCVQWFIGELVSSNVYILLVVSAIPLSTRASYLFLRKSFADSTKAVYVFWKLRYHNRQQ